MTDLLKFNPFTGTFDIVSVSVGTGTFVFDQPVPAATWAISHNMDARPSVTVVTSADDVVEGDVHYVDANNLQVSFAAPFAGRAYLNA